MKTSELAGTALDWAVSLITNPEWSTECRLTQVTGVDKHYSPLYSPSGDWAHGGPIIEREDISFRKYHRHGTAHGTYYARVCRERDVQIHWHNSSGFQCTGPTPLIAAMRCFVARKLGDEVDVPEELT